MTATASDSVAIWLRSLPDTLIEETPSTPPRKRRRIGPPTPDSSKGSKRVLMSSLEPKDVSGKRPPLQDDETPRPQRTKRLQTTRSESSYSVSEDSLRSREISDRSGRTSPQKHLQALKLSADGIKFGDLINFANKPPSLKSFLREVDIATEGQGIISPSLRDSLRLASASNEDLEWVTRSDNYFSANRDSLGHTPSPDEVLDILAAAAECSTNGHPEANWNMEVHQKVLELAFRPRGQQAYKHLINFMGCTTASILAEYGRPSPSKKVDFCVYIEPSSDPEPDLILPAILDLRRSLPGAVLNFTDFAPVDQRPIAFSLETKKPSEGFDAAKLQLGVWNMAHWGFLRYLTKMKMASTGCDENVGPSFCLPSFIPGVIIQGHDWHLVITTPENYQTRFWQKVTIGSTSSSKGVYQIICILQILRRWAHETYWPWLRRVIVGV